MKKSFNLIYIGVFALVFALLHAIALEFSIYWTVPHADSFMHLYGGVLGALIVLYVLTTMGLTPRSIFKRIFLMMFVCLCVFSVAVVWELWEIYVGFNDPFENGWVVDTIWDLIMGTLGALVGFFYYDKKIRHAE